MAGATSFSAGLTLPDPEGPNKTEMIRRRGLKAPFLISIFAALSKCKPENQIARSVDSMAAVAQG